jgi:hypothetical protein
MRSKSLIFALYKQNKNVSSMYLIELFASLVHCAENNATNATKDNKLNNSKNSIRVNKSLSSIENKLQANLDKNDVQTKKYENVTGFIKETFPGKNLISDTEIHRPCINLKKTTKILMPLNTDVLSENNRKAPILIKTKKVNKKDDDEWPLKETKNRKLNRLSRYREEKDEKSRFLFKLNSSSNYNEELEMSCYRE